MANVASVVNVIQQKLFLKH